MDKLKDVLSSVAENTACYAADFGERTSALARRVGPKRGGIALGVLVVAVATPFVIRAIRARNAEADVDEAKGTAKPRKRKAARRAHAPTAHA